MAEPSDPGDKLQAALVHDLSGPDKDFPADYLAWCRQWYAALSAVDKSVVAVARATFEKGKEAEAEKIAEVLPSAPKFPQL
jgi:hypothetical protein